MNLRTILFKSILGGLLLILAVFSSSSVSFAQAESPKEDDYFKIMRVPAPEGYIYLSRQHYKICKCSRRNCIW